MNDQLSICCRQECASASQGGTVNGLLLAVRPSRVCVHSRVRTAKQKTLDSATRQDRSRVNSQTLRRALLATLFFIPTAVHADPPKTPRISLAGTFNNWNTSDPDYTLKPVADKFELVRAWPCGTSEFKFVFDGSWAKHLGDAGGGKLVQPGGDIKLVIPQSGTYAIEFDLTNSSWKMQRRSPTRPRAVIQVIAASGNEYFIDGRLSEAREGKKIQKYFWKVDRKGLKPPPAIDHDASASTFQLIQREPEPTTVTLVVSDGEESTPANATISQKNEWLLRDSDSLLEIQMAPLRPGIWGFVFDDGLGSLSGLDVRSNASNQPIVKLKIENEPSDHRRPTLVRYDEHARTLSIVKSGVHRFLFRPTSLRLDGAPIVERVDLVGDFNSWRVGAMPMSMPLSEERVRTNWEDYECIVELPDGVHRYKFAINGAIFVADPNSDPKLTDADGNSGVRVGPDPDKLGPVKPNEIVGAALFHDPSNNAWFAPVATDAATVTVRTLADDAQSVTMHIDGVTSNVPLRRLERRDGFDYWKGQVIAGAGPWTYWFDVNDGTATTRLAANGATAEATPKSPFQGNLDMHFKTPDWAKTAVWYQIFPERFRNGDTSNDPPGTVPWKHAWFKPYKGPSTGGGTVHEKGKFFEYIYDRRYGGDLQGVRDKLPYLRELGVTAIYFNPIFHAESLHKYDASDYRHIDDFFGVKDSLKKIKGETEDPKTWQWSETDRLFLDFLQEAHRQGFKVVLDGVFNHVGRDFWAFKDVLKHGEKSPYAGWFDIESFKPFHYKAWDKPDGSLPRLKHDDALGLATPVREHIFAITKRWMDPNGDGDPSDGIDGWRLDVAADINVNFWRDWRALVKKTNPDAYIVAELWQESRVWLDGQSFDAVMNYPFAVRSQRFFVNNKKASKPSQFLKEIHEILGWYAPHVNHCLQNLYDSHDTDRLASMFLNPDLEYDQSNRPQDNGPNYNTGRPTAENYHRMKLAVTWQMMFLGSPMIYYGNEVGLFGADDPTDRKPMLWPDLLPYNDPDERIEPGIFEHHQRMIAIRNTYRALRLGSFESVYDDDRRGIAAFVRRLGGEAVLVVINNSDKNRRVRLPSPWDDEGVVYRVDDPEVATMVPAKDAMHRATVKILENAASPQTIEKGVLKGMTLAPRTAGVYVLVKK